MRLLPFVFAATVQAQSLPQRDLVDLDRHLADLRAGKAGSAVAVDRFADSGFAGLRRIAVAFVEPPASVEPHTHRALVALLSRVSRGADAPWPMVELYSPDLARLVLDPASHDGLGGRLFDRLAAMPADRASADLAVRLCPVAALDRLAVAGGPLRTALLDAFTRRLRIAREHRPLPDLPGRLRRIIAPLREAPHDELLLAFAALWPDLRADYRAALERCLRSEAVERVRIGLSVQQHAPELLELNAAIVERFGGTAGSGDPALVEAALTNFAFDERQDHSAALRALWGRLPVGAAKARRACLFAMGVHPAGNDAIALSAVRENPFDFVDVASPILARGERTRAAEAVAFVLAHSTRGHEEALRLARRLGLAGFEHDALKFALDPRREQILRQSALAYLELSDGKVRRGLLPLLGERSADVRLSAIRALAPRKGLTDADLDEMAPALIRVAQSDPSMGHRQEAVYAVGNWRSAAARPFLDQMLGENPPDPPDARPLDERLYWPRRFRLVALLGLLKLGDAGAQRELAAMHRTGTPGRRMEVLLAWLDAGVCPPAAFEDLASSEPKLVATAAALIDAHGSPDAKRRLREHFADRPLWRRFADAGIDDHNILRAAGLAPR